MAKTMTVYEWCVIDPRLDRPFFSSSPPTTLERLSEMKVIRFEKQVPDPSEPDEAIFNSENQKNLANSMFEVARERFEKEKSRK
jgi:hypothetical protein